MTCFLWDASLTRLRRYSRAVLKWSRLTGVICCCCVSSCTVRLPAERCGMMRSEGWERGGERAHVHTLSTPCLYSTLTPTDTAALFVPVHGRHGGDTLVTTWLLHRHEVIQWHTEFSSLFRSCNNTQPLNSVTKPLQNV